MATKTSDLLGSLPSVSDLLEKPPIRVLVNRWNRSVVAAGVRSFLDELRSDVERRAAGMSLPSIGELAERAARHVLLMRQPSLRPAINATGRFYGVPWAGIPLADAALERIVGTGRDFVCGPMRTTDAAATAGDAAALVCRLTGAQAATAVHSYAGAVWLMLASVAEGDEVIVSRAELGDIEWGCPLASLGATSGAVLREVGTTNRTAPADYESAISPRTAALIAIRSDHYRVVGETASVEFGQLVGLARERELILCDVLGGAPLVDHPSTRDWAARSAQASVAAGADLVIVRGEGFLGGPTCGILLGRREIIERIEEHPHYCAWQLDPITVSALVATLELYEDREHVEQTLPLLELLSAPVENLRQRAERLAPQLAAAPAIAAAEPVATQNGLGLAARTDRALPSFGVALTAADGQVAALDKRLTAAPRPICGRVEGDRLVLDLRTVFPRQDQELVDAIVGKVPPAAET
jgi:L-seryl-tRNA(Ser) seleniumtransferase